MDAKGKSLQILVVAAMSPPYISSQDGPPNLLELTEELRAGLREAVRNPRGLLPAHMSPVYGRYSQAQYENVRVLLLSNSSALSHLPDWLREQPTLAGAITVIARSIDPTDTHYLRHFRQVVEVDLKPLVAQLESDEIGRTGNAFEVASRRVQVRIDQFFRKPVALDHRAAQVLRFARGEEPDTIRMIWRNVLLFHPALAAIIERCLPENVDYLDFFQRIAGRTIDIAEAEISDKFIFRVLKKSFGDPNYPAGYDELSPYGEKIRSLGHLSASNLLIGPLISPNIVYSAVMPLRLVGQSYQKQGQQKDYLTYTSSFIERLIRAADALQSLDPSGGRQQFVTFHDGKRIRIRPFGTWAYCQSPHLSQDTPQAFRNNVIQPGILFSNDSIELLEDLINSNASEVEFQRFFEANPAYLEVLGSYTKIYPQLVLTEDTGNRLIPDFFLENLHTGFCDICDLKRPTELIVKECGGRPQFRDRVMSGIRQLNHYRNFFDDRDNRRRFETTYGGLRAYRPRVLLIIGRTESFLDELERVQLTSELRDWVSIHTYDDVLASARQWKERVEAIL